MSDLTLHGYWRSSASYRVRIALALKGVSYDQVGHDLRTDAQRAADYRAIAPGALVPALEMDDGALSQSMAIIEWIDETFPDPPLLPIDPRGRAVVRAMAQTIACDVHPLNNLRVLRYLRQTFAADQASIDAWAATWMTAGFDALEVMISKEGGAFAYGDHPTVADCLIVPQLYSARRFNLDVSQYERLLEIEDRLLSLPGIAAAHPDKQSDADPA
jgi:maleylpyruvate isomerase